MCQIKNLDLHHYTIIKILCICLIYMNYKDKYIKYKTKYLELKNIDTYAGVKNQIGWGVIKILECK